MSAGAPEPGGADRPGRRGWSRARAIFLCTAASRRRRPAPGAPAGPLGIACVVPRHRQRSLSSDASRFRRPLLRGAARRWKHLQWMCVAQRSLSRRSGLPPRPLQDRVFSSSTLRRCTLFQRTGLFALLLLAASDAALAQSTPEGAVQALQQFVNRNGVTRTEERSIRVETQFTITAVQGCRITITREFDMGALNRIQSTFEMDLAAMSPQVEIQSISDRPDVSRVHVITSAGDETMRGETRLTVLGRESRSSDKSSELAFVMPTSVIAEAARLLTAAITGCGGQPHTPEAMARISARRLHVQGNDPKTFPLKGQCRDMISGLVSNSARFAGDSTFTVVRQSEEHRVDISGNLVEGGAERSFTCKFRQSGDTWIPDGQPTVSDASHD
jgi:hypothetical protein